MGLVEKFKKTLSMPDIFYHSEEKFISPIDTVELEETVEYIEPPEPAIPNINLNQNPVRKNRFSEMTTEAITKIQNTPYWNEFSMKSQEKMISKYFDSKIKRGKYVGTKYSLTDKLSFIEEVLKATRAA